MNRRSPGNGHDPRVVPFRPRKQPPLRPSIDWRQVLILFVALFVLVAGLGAVFSPTGFGQAEAITALVFALVVTGADLVRRRRGGA